MKSTWDQREGGNIKLEEGRDDKDKLFKTDIKAITLK